ncbi:C39 family peptidase [Marinithermus hydrothermalis]|uniref:Peptidase C39 bacteriocin processing n=1 Tax=Marinithermus hydrothermalis (strain DSM 14884 / JCM 11576 / T1) TaxID=869210 RepID=F2NKI7_MARHT|nr:cysteine peptidase family C39 domain-containing protein [Marinithermus hydrothermalis]AEB12647.1 peptidase C39 bacteriocin processing [Marinithermus hydrothermalis DSM 14884]
MRLHALLCLALLAAGLGLAAPTPYCALRYTHVVGQTDWYTCGAAAVATLLTYYYADPATEREVLEIAFKETQAAGKDPLKGLTALALKRALEQRGYAVKAYRVNLEQLVAYFEAGGLPLIAHVTQPQRHFLVIAGLLRDPRTRRPHLLLADPSWGRRVLEVEDLLHDKGFSGVVLLAIPKNSAQLEQVQALQVQELAWAQQSLNRLRALRGWMP